MHIGEIYAITAFVSALYNFLIYNRLKVTKYEEATDKRFGRVLIYYMLFSITDCMWGLAFSGHFFGPRAFTVITYGFHVLASFSAFLWLGFIYQYLKEEGNSLFLFYAVRILLLMVQLGILIANVFTGDAFYVTSQGEYVVHELRTLQYWLYYSYYFILIVFCLVRLFTLPKEEKGKYDTVHRRYRNTILYSGILLLFGIGQYFFYDAALYSMGFAFTAFAIFAFNQTTMRENYLEEKHQAINKEQLDIIRGMAGTFKVIYSVDMDTGGFDIFRKKEGSVGIEKLENHNIDYFKIVVEQGNKMVAPEDKEKFLLTVDRNYLRGQLENKAEHSLIIRVFLENSYKYYEYRFVRSIEEDHRMLVGVYDIDREYRKKLKEQEELLQAREHETALELETELLDMAAHRDIMTALFNRRAYEDHVKELEEASLDENLVYVSMDVNGLKAINDDLGHDAGDELIKGAAFCMKKCFGPYGKVYRHGGDEFSAILFIKPFEIEKVFQRFERILEDWHGELVREVAVSYGYVTVKEMGQVPIIELEKIADKRMYENKTLYYARKGIDRRGQQDAYEAIRNTYLKILKVNLTTESFQSITIHEEEANPEKGFHEKISMWLSGFAKSGYVHPDDAESYLEKTDITYLRDFFHNNKEANYCIHYRRKKDQTYHQVMMEIIPAKEYLPENQIVFLYVKKID